MKQYYYETHLHTAPVSRCAKATVRDTLEYYKGLGYDGVFITNHFIDGSINIADTASYKEKMDFYFSDFEQGEVIGREIGLKVFLGIESTYADGTDFLIYGPDKAWFMAHTEWQDMKKSQQLAYFASCGALIIHAHPFREAGYIDHIRLFPRQVHGVEVINASRDDFTNRMAAAYAEAYRLLPFAGSDNHHGAKMRHLAGISSDTPFASVRDMTEAVRKKDIEIFVKDF